METMCLIPFHLHHSRLYYELSSLKQPPLNSTSMECYQISESLLTSRNKWNDCTFLWNQSLYEPKSAFWINTYQRRLVGGAIGGRAHYKWNIGTVSNTSKIWKPHVWLHFINSIPAITMSPGFYSSSQQPPLVGIDPECTLRLVKRLISEESTVI